MRRRPALHRWRHAEHVCGFLDRESAECSKLDDPGKFGVDRLQAIERVIQGEDGHLVGCGHVLSFVERYAAHTVAPLARAVTTGVIDQDAAHDVGGHAKEVRPVLPVDLSLIDEPDEHLVHKGRGLQGVVSPLAPKLARGHPAKLRVDEWQQLTERSAVATTPIAEQCRDVRRRHPWKPSTSVRLSFDPFGQTVARSAHRTETTVKPQEPI